MEDRRQKQPFRTENEIEAQTSDHKKGQQREDGNQSLTVPNGWKRGIALEKKKRKLAWWPLLARSGYHYWKCSDGHTIAADARTSW